MGLTHMCLFATYSIFANFQTNTRSNNENTVGAEFAFQGTY